MTYQCEKCDREWDDQAAADNEFFCARKCGGQLVSLADVAVPSSNARLVNGALAPLPSLLAIPLAEYAAEDHPVMRLHRLCDAVEIVTRFSAIVALAELRSHLREKPLPESLLKAIQPSIERPTFGQWRGILDALLNHLGSGDSLVVPELIGFAREHLLPALRDGVPDLPEKGLVDLRNLLVHGGAQPHAWAEERLGIVEPWLENAIGNLTFFADVRVCYYVDGAVLELAGETEAQPLDEALQDALSDLVAHVVLLRDDRWLDLWPLCDYGRASSASLEGRREAKQDTSLVYLRAERERLLYAALGAPLPHAERSRQEHPDVLSGFRELFRLNDRAEHKAKKGLPADFESEIQADAAALVGREAELKHVKIQIKAAQSGVLWISGPGGIGKSFLMAKLAVDLRGDPKKQCRIAWRFKTSDQERCSRTAFLRHAVTRLAEWLNKEDYTPEPESNGLYNQLEALLVEVSALEAPDPRGRAPRVLFLLDGMDEIERLDGDVPNFPLRLFRDNVVWLCAGRPEGRLPQVFSTNRVTHVFPATDEHPEGGLPAMSDQDIRAMLLERTGSLKYKLLPLDEQREGVVSNAAVDAVIERAQGLPLYVHLVIEDILAGHFRFDELEGRLPPTLSDYYDDLLRRLSIGELQALLTPLVVTIAWAIAPLDERTLHLLMVRRKVVSEGEDGPTLVRRGLEAVQSMIRPVPISDEGLMGYEPYHPRFREHIQADVSGIIGQQNPITRSEFCELTTEWSDIPNEHPARKYVLRFGRRHLIDAERWEDLETLLTDIFFLEAKNEAGMAFELAGDFTAAVASLAMERPKRNILRLLEEALRREVHFIVRHAQGYPQGLFQCLWNHAWWYDCDEAAAHYVELDGWNETNAPWLGPDDQKLCRVLERWRQSKREASPQSAWLASRHPPPTHLGTAQLAVLRGHEDEVNSASFSPDGRRIVSGSDDHTVRVWDSESSAELAVLRGHEYQVNSVSFSPGGRRIVSAGHFDGTVRVWDAESGAELATLRGHEAKVNSVSFSPDGRRIVSGSDDGTVRVWDSESGAELAVLRGYEGVRGAGFMGWVSSLSFSPDGQRIVSGSGDGAVRVWDAESGAELALLREHGFGVTSVSFSPDGRRIVYASHGGGEFCVKDAQSGASLAVLCGHERAVNSVSFSPDGRRIVSAGDDDTVRVWDAEDRRKLALFRGFEGWVSSVSFSPDGRRIVSGCLDDTVRVWDSESGAELAVSGGHEGEDRSALGAGVRSVSFSPDGRRIVGCLDDTVRVWDSESGAELAVLRGHREEVGSVSFSPDGQRIVSSGYSDTSVRVWDAESGAESAVLRGHEGAVSGVAFSPGGDRVVSGGAGRDGNYWGDTDVRVWDVALTLWGRIRRLFVGRELAVLRGHKARVTSVSYSPTGNQIVSASVGGTLRVWDASSGAELLVLRGLERPVVSASYSPDGRRIAALSDEEVRVWNAETGQCLEVIPGTGDVRAIAAESPSQRSWRAIARRHETVIEPAGGGDPMARFPVALRPITTHPNGRTWAGVNYRGGNDFCIITLEGEPDSAERET